MGKILGRFILPHPPILIPQIGGEEARKGQGTLDSFAAIGKKIAELKPQNIIIISPHAPMFNDKFYINTNSRISGDMSQFKHKEILLGFNNNTGLIDLITDAAKNLDIKAGAVSENLLRRYGLSYDLDHGIIVPMYFISHFYTDFNLIPVSLTSRSPKEHYLMGEAIAQGVLASDEDAVIIASGDLSHKLKEDGPYGFAEEGPIFDELLISLLKENNIEGLLSIDSKLEEKAAQCGLYSFYILLGTLKGYNMAAKVHSYEKPFGVGYLTATIDQGATTENKPLASYLSKREASLKEMQSVESPPLALARAALSYYLDTGKEMTIPENFPEEWISNQGGTFVSFKKDNNLRGCVGTISATQPNLAEEIINNAISAGTKDYRFSPITPGEVAELTVSVDVLGDIEDIESEDDLDPLNYGVIVTSGSKRGLLLPNLEGVDSVEQQIRIAKEKAGIPFFKKVNLQRFKVVRYE